MTHENGQTADEIACREVANRISAYLDAYGGHDRNARIALHLAGCAGCAAYARQIALVRNLIALLPECPAMPSNLDGLHRACAVRRGQPR